MALKKELFRYLLIIFLLVFLIYLLYNAKSLKQTKYLTDSLFKKLQTELVNVNKYLIYGTHLNIEGSLDIDLHGNTVDDVKIVLKDIKGSEISYTIDYNINGQRIAFKTSDRINEGINLEEISEGKYYILLKTIIKHGDIENDKYYLLDNTTGYKELEYYTITKDDKNKRINITSADYLLDGIIVPYMKITVKGHRLPDNIYDIVIDPGHGGNDCGAVNGNYYESKIVLDYCIDLKKNLESLGLKVKLIRDSDIYVDSYGEKGRAVIPNIVKAKYVFSVHLNSSKETLRTGGVEIYAPPMSNLYFAKLISDNIANIAKTTYSPNKINKVLNGVYIKNYTTNDIQEVNREAALNGYKQYNITTETPYMFMIRETGGIATHAYVDGRNKDYFKNIYYNSNMGVEGYLLELGFMSCPNDLHNILNSKKLYVYAITKSIQEYLKIVDYKY